MAQSLHFPVIWDIFLIALRHALLLYMMENLPLHHFYLFYISSSSFSSSINSIMAANIY